MQSVRNLVTSRPDVSICLEEYSRHTSLAFVSSRFTGSVQKVVLNPSALVTSQYFTDDPKSGPFVGVNSPSIDYQEFISLGFNRPIIDMVRRILLTSASFYEPSHNFLWLIVSKHNTSSVRRTYLRDAVQTVITKSASSSKFSHLWNNDTRFSFKFGRVKPNDLLMLVDVCGSWFDSHTCPAPSDFGKPQNLHIKLLLKTNSASSASDFSALDCWDFITPSSSCLWLTRGLFPTALIKFLNTFLPKNKILTILSPLLLQFHERLYMDIWLPRNVFFHLWLESQTRISISSPSSTFLTTSGSSLATVSQDSWISWISSFIIQGGSWISHLDFLRRLTVQPLRISFW
ncbi:unnamed protein product [Rhizophagus irregularis]|nr:unnamed protein product [Rhizophagus irregularis]